MRYLILLAALYSVNSFAVTGTCTIVATGETVINPVRVMWCNPTEYAPDASGQVLPFDPTTSQQAIYINCGTTSLNYTISTTIPEGRFPTTVESSSRFPPLKTAMGLTDGLWYCALTAGAAVTGLESDFSNELKILIDNSLSDINMPKIAVF